MNKIRDIQKKIHAILDRYPPGTIESPLYLQTYGWLAYAEEYRRAAIAVSGDMHLVNPMLNLTGHAIECALKGFLSASGATPPVSHDLVKLLEMCHSHGLQPLSDLQIASLIWVSHYYHQDLVSKTKYKARFPTRTDEMVGGPIPSSDVCSVIVKSVCDQTKHKLKLAGLWSESTTADDPGDAEPCAAADRHRK